MTCLQGKMCPKYISEPDDIFYKSSKFIKKLKAQNKAFLNNLKVYMKKPFFNTLHIISEKKSNETSNIKSLSKKNGTEEAFCLEKLNY